jgi:hypothetical protein
MVTAFLLGLLLGALLSVLVVAVMEMGWWDR